MHSSAIIALVKQKHKDGKSLRVIAEETGLQKATVQYMVKNAYGRMKRKTGVQKKITKRLQVRVKRACEQMLQSGEKVTARKIREECALDASRRTVQRFLKSTGYRYKKARHEILLSAKHKADRVFHCKMWLKDRVDWNKVVFSDEKKFNMDGPDGWHSYARDGVDIIRDKRQAGGGGVMVWGMVFPDGEIFLHMLEGRQNSGTYKALMEDVAVPAIMARMGDDFVFQQDNCSIHVSSMMRDFFEDEGIRLLSWPSRSPDLNIMENVWEMLSLEVYDGPQLRNKATLVRKIRLAVEKINREKTAALFHLYSSFVDRLFKCIFGKGQKINY
jgi:transposase